MKLSFREKLLITLLALVLIIGCGGSMLVYPAYLNYKNKQSTLAQDVFAKTHAEAQVSAATNVETNRQSALDKAMKAAASILPSVDTPSLNIWLCNMASASGLSVERITFSSPVSADVGTNIQSTQTNSGSALPAYKLGD